MKTGSETILLVEDDVMVRELNRDVLEKSGYRVIVAKDGQEALDLYYANRDCICMLILDVILPKKNGREVYDTIIAENAGIRTLFMSGYAGGLVHGVFNGPVNFMPKPVSPMNLLHKVREILDS